MERCKHFHEFIPFINIKKGEKERMKKKIVHLSLLSLKVFMILCIAIDV